VSYVQHMENFTVSSGHHSAAAHDAVPCAALHSQGAVACLASCALHEALLLAVASCALGCATGPDCGATLAAAFRCVPPPPAGTSCGDRNAEFPSLRTN
jgi:hypothetical protein